MYRISGFVTVAAAACACVASSAAVADNLLGLYAGVGVGESTVRSDRNFATDYGYYDYNHDHHTAWKAIVGVRPIPIVGAELEYIDFGHPGSDQNYDYNYGNNSNYGPDSHPRAIAAFGVGHIPLPLPFLDVYGKAGAARLHTNVNGFDSGCFENGFGTCAPGTGTAAQSRWDTRFAYGAGVQYRFFFGLAVRAEYERISSPYGDPDLASVAVTWTF